MKWGIDLGGTKVECAVLKEDNSVAFRDRLPTEQQNGYQHILGQIKKVVDLAANEVGEYPEIIGMCTPGSIDEETGLLKNSNTVVLNQKPFLQDIEAILNAKVLIENDANCFALAEYHLGAGATVNKRPKVLFGVIMGTGVGGGVVVNGEMISGPNHIGGEWGHNYLDESGGPCYCGKTGCVENVISGTALQKFYLEKSGEQKKLKEIIELARKEENQNAVATLDRLIHFFGLGISVIVNILDPDMIVIGGGVGNIDEIYTRGVEAAKQFVFNPKCKLNIVRPQLGDSAGVFGAAFLQPA